MDFQRELDRVKISLFRGKNSAFYGSLLSSTEFIHKPDADIPANIDMFGMSIELNDKFFEYKPEVQETILVHLLNHTARLHGLRRGNRDPKLWDKACDIEINNHLARERYNFDSLSPHQDNSLVNLPAEDIYKILEQENNDDDGEGDGNGSGWGGDSHSNTNNGNDQNQGSQQPSPQQIMKQIAAVEQANQQSKMMGGEGHDYGDASQAIADVLKQFKKPRVNWKTLLRRYFTDLVRDNYTFARPNRRHEDIFLPSLQDEEGKLAKIQFFVDVSGSVTEAELKTFLNEFAYIKNTYNPEELHMVQFDTQILREDVFKSSDRLKKVDFVYGGGTCLVPVRELIVQHKPKIAIIMSDLEVRPMEPVPGVDIIWLCVNNERAKVNQGKLIHVKVDKY